MKKLVFILITALMLTGCAVVDAEPSAPIKQAEVVEAIGAPEQKLQELTDQDIETLKESCVMIYADNGETQVQGSAVAIGENRYLTAYHAIADGRTNLKTSDGEKLTIEDYSAELDIMSLISEGDAVPVKIGDSDIVWVGDEVVIIGSPREKKNTAIHATVRSTVTNIVVYDVVGGGTSGAGAFDTQGNLIGIVIGSDAVKYESYIVPINAILEQL